MNELKVGIFTLAAITSVIFMSFMVTKNQSGFGKYVTYRTMVDDASGIFKKTPIKVAGINAGRILNIELQGNKALVTFEVLEQVKVTAGSILHIKAVGFLGDKYLEIAIETTSDLRLEENALLLSNTNGGMEGLIKNANEILGDVKDIVKSLKNDLAPAGQKSPVSMILGKLDTILNDMGEVTQGLKRVVTGNEESLNNMVSNLERISDELAYHLDMNADKSLMRDFKKIGPVLDDVKKITDDMKQIVADLKAGRGSVGKFLREDQIADQVKETLASVQKVIGKVDTIRSELSVFTGYHSNEGSLTEAGLKIYPSPERFYQLGITTSDVGAKKKKRISSTINGVSTVEDREEYDKDTYRFTMQLGRKINKLSLRGGIIESAGGLGLDYDLFPSALRLSMDAYDYRENQGVNWRVTSDVQLWNVFYGRVSGDDLGVSDTRSFSVSAGLKFSDEDLKGLMGLLLR